MNIIDAFKKAKDFEVIRRESLKFIKGVDSIEEALNKLNYIELMSDSWEISGVTEITLTCVSMRNKDYHGCYPEFSFPQNHLGNHLDYVKLYELLKGKEFDLTIKITGEK